MTTSNDPLLRLDPALSQAAQDVLREGETLLSFVEEAMRLQIRQRLHPAEFFARGLASRDRAKVHRTFVSSGDVITMLEARLAKAKKHRG